MIPVNACVCGMGVSVPASMLPPSTSTPVIYGQYASVRGVGESTTSPAIGWESASGRIGSQANADLNRIRAFYGRRGVPVPSSLSTAYERALLLHSQFQRGEVSKGVLDRAVNTLLDVIRREVSRVNRMMTSQEKAYESGRVPKTPERSSINSGLARGIASLFPWASNPRVTPLSAFPGMSRNGSRIHSVGLLPIVPVALGALAITGGLGYLAGRNTGDTPTTLGGGIGKGIGDAIKWTAIGAAALYAFTGKNPIKTFFKK